MAVSLTQVPSGTQYSYGEIVYTVESTLIGPSIPAANLPVQFSILIDIYEGNTLLTRRKKQPNPQGTTIINIASVLNDFLEYDLVALGSSTSTAAVNGQKTFTLQFGEEYLVNGTLTPDANQVSSDVSVIKGVAPYNSNDVTEAINIPTVLSGSGTTYRVHRDDFMTISTINSGLVIHHNVTIPDTGDSHQQVISGETYTFNIYDERSDLGEVRFAWFNDAGGIDYFTADQEGTQSVSNESDSYRRSVIDFTGNTSSNRVVGANRVYRSSVVEYNKSGNTTINKNTKWLTAQEAELVAGMFSSTQVFIQSGSNFIPVTILNSSHDVMVTGRQSELFQYQIQYRLSNDIRTK